MQPDIFAEISSRLETATGPDPIIDALVKLAFRPPQKSIPYADIHHLEPRDDCVRFYVHKTDENGEHYYADMAHGIAEPVTGSIDAVVALIRHARPTWGWGVREESVCSGMVSRHGQFEQNWTKATPPLALLAAFMVAHADH